MSSADAAEVLEAENISPIQFAADLEEQMHAAAIHRLNEIFTDAKAAEWQTEWTPEGDDEHAED